eukprot:6523115-Pyramimonas_sp.AAC.1
MSSGAATIWTICSGSSSLRSRSVRSGLVCNGGLNPQHYRAQSRHGTSQFSTTQLSTAFGTVHQDQYAHSALQPGTFLGTFRGAFCGESPWHVARRVPWHVPWH